MQWHLSYIGLEMKAMELETTYITKEIEKVKRRLDVYEKLYAINEVKSITLKRLITTKRDELRLLSTMLNEPEQNG